ncbi:MAG: hypothetical protein QXE50_08115 [Nitrososphaerota archaeon]
MGQKRTSGIHEHPELVLLLKQTEERLAAIERKLYGNGESLESQIVRLATKIDSLEQKQSAGLQEAIAKTVKEIMRQQKSSNITGYVMAAIAGLGLIFTIIYNILRG